MAGGTASGPTCNFAKADAWEIGAAAAARYDIYVSNGLNIYVAEPERRIELYRSFQEMLVSGGRFITSALTWSPETRKSPNERRRNQDFFNGILDF